jgi:hypothetical protein
MNQLQTNQEQMIQQMNRRRISVMIDSIDPRTLDTIVDLVQSGKLNIVKELTDIVDAIKSIEKSDELDEGCCHEMDYQAMSDSVRELALMQVYEDILDGDFRICRTEKYMDQYMKIHNCEIVQIPRRKKETGMLAMFGGDTMTLTDEDSENFLEDIRKIEASNFKNGIVVNIHIYLNTKGGKLATAETIVKTILGYGGEIRVFVNDKAMSAGTLIALCAHKLYLRRFACLGQIDPQLGSGNFWVPTNSLAQGSGNTGNTGNTDDNPSTSMVDQFETSWVRDLIRFGAGPAGNANQRVRRMVDQIAIVRSWSDSFKSRIIDNLLNQAYGHDQPYDYQDLMKFWNDRDNKGMVNGDTGPELYNDWPDSAIILKGGSPEPDKDETKPSMLSAFGL